VYKTLTATLSANLKTLPADNQQLNPASTYFAKVLANRFAPGV